MDDVVAVKVQLAEGTSRYFLTWGRIQDPVDPEPVCDLVLEAAKGFALGGEPVSAEVCDTLREAADSDAPYFYECLLKFGQERIPFGEGYDAWRQEKARAMRSGREIAYCGSPIRAAHRVAVVLDPGLASVEELAREYHVWAVRTLETEEIAARVWSHRDPGQDRWNESGLTLFNGSPTPEESLVSVLASVELHHGEYSHDPSVSVIEVLGTGVTGGIQEALGELGFTQIRVTDHGFIARRAG